MTTLGPETIAALLGRPSPTEEQKAVITAPLRPSVVVAGAGSGKTETMASRVVWLVANGVVRPEQVLGLTFTRKAAGELSGRVRRRLAALAATGRVSIPATEPTISTYDAFASSLVSEHGARLGIEPGRRLLSPAGAWQRAARLVHGWDSAMDDVEYAPATVVEDVLSLHEQLATHVREVDDVEGATRSLLALIESLPPGPSQRRAVHSKLERVLTAQRARLRLLPLVERYRAELADADLTDFATVAEQAARVAARFGEVGRQLREQYHLVLLDEFQDTSFAQLDLLLSLFGPDHPLTAVGDPFQSIYAWRGANADTLTAFATRFGAAQPVERHALRTSFRNARRILDVANHLADPLRVEDVLVDTLVPMPTAPDGAVRLGLHHSRSDQAAALADQVAAQWRHGEGAERPTIGVLVRKRDEIPAIEAALRDRDVPVEVVGLDGLLTVPEVSDVVALLQVSADPARGDALMRLLTGPVLRLGPRDLRALGQWARQQGTSPASKAPSWLAPSVGIAECLSHPPPPGWMSPAADTRLRTARDWVEQVRQRLHRPLPDVVADAAVVLGLDVETLARAQRTGGVGVSHLDRLVDEAAQFADVAPQAGLPEFLDYLDAGAEQERGLRRAAEGHAGQRVALLTVHAAKGLEWDVVAIAGLTEGGFPTRSRTPGGWLTDPGALPYSLRGDAAALPSLDTSDVTSQSDLAAAVEKGYEAGRAGHLAEERRLVYVAATRARRLLLCHGYRWGDGQRPKEPSRFVDEMSQCSGVDVETWLAEPGAPPDPTVDAPQWPDDPLGRHRPALESGAALVRDAVRRKLPPSRGITGRAAAWDEDVRLLLADRDAEARRARLVRLPSHLSATQLVGAGRDPAEMLDRLRRPMPARPRVQARQGTAFHAWVEQYYGRPGLLDLDELPGAADATAPPPTADLEELREAFMASAWAAREPREVEAPFEMVVHGVVVRGRADAVFADGDGIVVVDWKTGPPPTSPADAAARSAQLAVYRRAFAALYSLPDTQVRAVFHHVRENVTVEESGRTVSVDDLVTSVVRAASES